MRYGWEMKRRYAGLCLTFVLASCASEESKPKTIAGSTPAVTAPTPALDAAASAKVAVASIASVQIAQDCPDPKREAKADRAALKMKAKRAKGSGPLTQPCTQSTVQIAFTGKGTGSATVKIAAVRLKSADGKGLATLAVRMPSIWKKSGYETWDGVLSADSDSKASYKLSVPEWSAVETAVGRSSFDQMYTLEVEIEIGGTVTTLTSPQFERSRPLMIKT